MTALGSQMVCAGCGHAEAADAPLPFRCLRSGRGNIDHVLVAKLDLADTPWPDDDHANPFVRYRTLFHTWRLARRNGMSDAAYVELVEGLDAAVAGVDGTGFVVTPFVQADELGVGIKDETGNVSGSHKARHLFGLAIHLRVVSELGLWDPAGARLAIASCGNAALAAAVVANAVDLPLDVYIPTWANEAVVARLCELGAELTVCERNDGDPPGDPCYHAFRRGVAAGALPFTCQGPENGLVIDGGRTLGFELVEQLPAVETMCIQVGGGALFSAVAQALTWANTLGALPALPTLHAVQPLNSHPLALAWRALGPDFDITTARRNRSLYMQPWMREPKSIATGILDDETYDWAAICEALIASGGSVVLAKESTLRAARDDAVAATGIPVSATGAAGLAGVYELRAQRKLAEAARPAVLFTGKQR